MKCVFFNWNTNYLCVPNHLETFWNYSTRFSTKFGFFIKSKKYVFWLYDPHRVTFFFFVIFPYKRVLRKSKSKIRFEKSFVVQKLWDFEKKNCAGGRKETYTNLLYGARLVIFFSFIFFFWRRAFIEKSFENLWRVSVGLGPKVKSKNL